MKKTITIVLICICLYGTYRFINYGSLSRNCEYTEDPREIPAALKNTTLSLTMDEYVAIGNNPDHCTSSFQEINLEIISTVDINNPTIGRKYFENQGRNIEQLFKGIRFSLEKIVAQTKHGIGTIDSGSGPLYYFILKDDKGDIYEIATGELGYDEKDSFLSTVNNGKIAIPLSVRYLKQFNLSI